MPSYPDFTLVQLRYFKAAAELGSMTDAARHLHVAQSAISSAVAHLERSLGAQLFVRHHARGLTLTLEGRHILHEAGELLAAAGAMADTARGVGGSLSGPVVLGLFVTLGPFYLPRLLSDLATEHPLIRIELIEGDNQVLQDALRDARCEMALTYDLDLPSDFDREPLTAAAPYAILGPQHPLAGRTSGIRLHELSMEPMILLDLPHSREYFRSLMLTTGVEPRIRYRTSNYEIVRALVAQGHGYSILNMAPPSPTTYGGGAVTSVPLLDDLPSLPIVLTRFPALRPTDRANAVAARCRAVIAAESP